MENLQGIKILRGQDQNGEDGRQPQGILVPVQHLNHQSVLQELREQLNELITRMERLKEQKTLREKLKEQQEKLGEQQILIDTLLAEKQERQIEEQLESCRLMECNLEELRRSSDVNNSRASHDGLSYKSSTLKRKAPWLRKQWKCKKVAQTKQQNHSQMPGLQQCPNCGRYHPGNSCIGRRVCFGCRKPGHIIANCPEEATKKCVCYKCLETGHIIKDCSNHGKHHQDTNCNKQQFNPGVTGPRPCPKCGRYHRHSTDCDGKLICFKCQQSGHISVHCPQKAAELGLQNSGQMITLIAVEVGESSEMVPDAIV